MSSARDIHSVENYQKEQTEFRRFNQYWACTQAFTPAQPAQAGHGLLPAHITARDLAHNWIDIESTLLGIGANDSVNPGRSLPAIPEYKKMPALNLIDKAPLILPPKTEKQPKSQRLRYFLGGQTIVPRYQKVKLPPQHSMADI